MFRQKKLSESCSCNPVTRGYINVFHKVVCTFIVVLLLHCALQCITAMADAYQSVRKYEFTGKLSFYLRDNHFYHYVLILACVGSEFIFYLVQHHRIQQEKASIEVVRIFAVAMLVHLFVFLLSHFVPASELPPFSTEDQSILLFRHFAKKTVLPTVLYFIMIHLRVRKF